jgi:hypothetical protein
MHEGVNIEPKFVQVTEVLSQSDIFFVLCNTGKLHCFHSDMSRPTLNQKLQSSIKNATAMSTYVEGN